MSGLKANEWTDDDDDGPKVGAGGKGKEFECPSCSAHNPYDDGFGDGDEIRCFYCGSEFKVEARDDGRLRFREI